MAYEQFYDLQAMIHANPEYAWSWHCNLAMPIMDEIGVSHEEADRAAARIMAHIFDYDITTHPQWSRG